jgi:hypothetical protein
VQDVLASLDFHHFGDQDHVMFIHIVVSFSLDQLRFPLDLKVLRGERPPVVHFSN